MILGQAQLIGGDAVRDILKPFEISRETGLVFTAMRHNELFGTMSYTINYAYFLLLSLILFLCFRGKMVKNVIVIWSFVLLLFLSIYLSGSRSAFLAAFIGILFYAHLIHGVKASAPIMVCFLLTLFLAFLFFDKGSTNQNFWFFLSPDYPHILEAQRLGFIKVFIDYIGDPHLFYGLSSDKSFVVSYISDKYNLPFYLAEKTLNSIEDVYWVTLVIYYGIIGLSFYILFIYFLYRKLKTLRMKGLITDLQERLFLASKILIFLLIPLNFFSQAFEVRHFSFYFWAVIGIAASHFCQADTMSTNENLANK